MGATQLAALPSTSPFDVPDEELDEALELYDDLDPAEQVGSGPQHEHQGVLALSNIVIEERVEHVDDPREEPAQQVEAERAT